MFCFVEIISFVEIIAVLRSCTNIIDPFAPQRGLYAF